MRLRFRAKVFIGAVAGSAASLLVAALLLSWQIRNEQRAAIERRLTDEAEVTADLLSPSLDAAGGRSTARRTGLGR